MHEDLLKALAFCDQLNVPRDSIENCINVKFYIESAFGTIDQSLDGSMSIYGYPAKLVHGERQVYCRVKRHWTLFDCAPLI